jgi:hypothetical protein
VNSRRLMRRDVFLGGMAGAAGWDLMRWLLRRGPKVLAALGILVLAAWSVAPPVVRWLVGLTVLALIGLWLWGRTAPRYSRKTDVHLPRTTGEMWWRYVLGEWRDNAGRIIPLRDVAFRRDKTYHLVYVGYTCDIEQRLRQHAQDKPWFHDELVLDDRTHWYGSEAAARDAEERLIRHAAQSKYANERPRENRHHNASYDPRVSDEMRARAYA